MGKAVQHPLAAAQLRHRLAVVFLVEEEAGLLPVFKIYRIGDAVLGDGGRGGIGKRPVGQWVKALVLLHPLQLADSHVVALIDAAERLSQLVKDFCQSGKQHPLALLDAQRKHLRHQNVAEAVDRQSRELVGLAEDEAAVGEVLPHHGAAVVDGVAQPPLKEGLVKAVVGVAGD